MKATKILVIRFSSIGDIILTTPVLRCIKQQIPNVELHFLTKAGYAKMMQTNPYIDKLILFSTNLKEIKQTIQAENYDFVIDLHKNLRSYRVTMGLTSHVARFPKLNLRKWWYVRTKCNVMPNIHIVDRYFEPVAALGVKNDGKGLDYFLNNEDLVSMEDLPKTFHQGYVVIAVGSLHATKQIPSELIISICQQIQKPILLLGDANDSVKAETITNALGDHVLNGCGRYSLNQAASLIKNADSVITPDTGLMHIASAFEKKIVSIWGNTVPEFGMYPYLPQETAAHSKIVEIKNLSCRPCSKLGFRKCPKKHFHCMRDIQSSSVAQIINEWSKTTNKTTSELKT